MRLSSHELFQINYKPISGADGEYNGPSDITFEDMYRVFSHLNQYEHQDDTYWVIGQGKWDWYSNKPQADHTYKNTSGKLITPTKTHQVS